MQEKDLISIIVPVYKSEKYLKKCIDSILNQTYKNIEIILVNDGCPDKSGKICDDYAEKEKRIKIIHKENGGLSDARNKGIELASGKYIGFVDSDDYIEKNMYETLYNMIKTNNADISICSFYLENENDKIENMKNKFKCEEETKLILNKIQVLKELLTNPKIQNYAWDKLYKKELFKDIRFPIGRSFEDINVMYRLFDKVNKVVYTDVPKYHYVQREDSISHNNDIKNSIEYIEETDKRYTYIKNKYPELDFENNLNFLENSLYGHERCSVHGFRDLYKSNLVTKRYEFIKNIMKEDEKRVVKYLDEYKKSILYLLLNDRDLYYKEGKNMYLEKLENRNINIKKEHC